MLILDEPTSALSLQETERLFALLRDVRARGVAILYISHRLDEIFALADRITVMRDGQVVATLPARDATREQLIRLMVGRDLQAFYADLPDPEPRVRLEVRGLSRRGVLQDITLSIRAGEIVGLAGLVGAGRTELARCLFGVDPYDTGEMLVDGQPVRIRTPRDAVRLGIGFVPEDRKLQALVLILAVRQNTTLPLIPMLSRLGIFQQRRERVLAQRYVEELRIRTPSVDQRVMNLSGGNQQKVVLARWLAAQSRILILDEPTRGIDVGAKAEVHKLIADLARQGVAILLISSELPEVLAMSHRILVMREGRIVAEFPRSQATEERVLAAATGHASVMS
ncbi:sugar ABC transporter ATP-binding protein [Thermorudis peleae]|uniref:sugar ABC transporter ATP-binding protein n=1 Tax=Thermorudis peleae TaxID=1382356 RepID=UPI003BB0932B